MNYEQLNELSIFALRELARRTGVYSPTSKKKDELINDILDILEGRKEPHVAKTRQGRPPKNYGYTFADVLYHTPTQQAYQGPVLSQNVPTFKYETNGLISGYVEIVSPVSACLWVRENTAFNCIYIPNSLVNMYGLKTGDFIHAHLEQEEGQTIVGSISNINNCPIKKYEKNKRLDYSDIRHILPSKLIHFNKTEYEELDIKLGESVYIYGNDNNCNTSTIINMLNSSSATKKIYINTVLAEKNKIYLDDINGAVELFTSCVTDTSENAQHVVNLAIERAKRILERGDDVIIAVDDVKSVIGIDNDDMSLTKNLMSVTKDGENAGSITLFAIMPMDKSASLFEKLADKKFKMVEHKLYLL